MLTWMDIVAGRYCGRVKRVVLGWAVNSAGDDVYLSEYI